MTAPSKTKYIRSETTWRTCTQCHNSYPQIEGFWYFTTINGTYCISVPYCKMCARKRARNIINDPKNKERVAKANQRYVDRIKVENPEAWKARLRHRYLNYKRLYNTDSEVHHRHNEYQRQWYKEKWADLAWRKKYLKKQKEQRIKKRIAAGLPVKKKRRVTNFKKEK